MSSELDDAATPNITTDDVPPTNSNPKQKSANSGVASPSWGSWILQGLRAGSLRQTNAPLEGPSVWQMLLIVAIAFGITTALSRFEIAGAAEFSFRNWLWSWARDGLTISGVWLILNTAPKKGTHSSPVAAWFLLSAIATVPLDVVILSINIAMTHGVISHTWTSSRWFGWSFYLGWILWSIVIAWRLSKSVNRSNWIGVAMVLWTLLIMGLAVTVLNVRSWEPTYAGNERKEDQPTFTLSQQAFEKQQSLLNDTLHAVKPHKGNQRQIYGLIFAPYSQDVFLRESTMVQEVLEQNFGAQDRIIRLVNNPKVKDTAPWATNLNLERSLQALAKNMDRDRDVLVLYLTSHGGADFKLATLYWPLEVESLTAGQLREMLDKVGIRNRVIAVSACYSGGWIEQLKNDHTLVMTAADKDHTSFGCGSRSELTYFGRAVFDEQLRNTVSFEDAFKAAVPIIQEREKEGHKDDGFSNPQIFVGNGIRTVLDDWASQRLTHK